jgi:predicted  nucleic acid-binding Zn-ribbon protein
MPHFYTDDEFIDLIDAIENKKIFKKKIDGQEVIYDFSKEIAFDFSNVMLAGNLKPDLVMLIKAINKNKNVVGLKLNNTPLDPTQDQEFTDLLLKNSILTEVTSPKNLSTGSNFLIQNHIQEVAENYFEFMNMQRQRNANVSYSNPKIIRDIELIGKIEDLIASNDPVHFKLLEHLLSSLPSGPIKRYYSNYSEFTKLQKEREAILNGLDHEIATENRNLAKIMPKINQEKQKAEKSISDLEERKFRLSTNKTALILKLSQTQDRAENDRLEKELEVTNAQLQEIATSEPNLRKALEILKKSEKDSRSKLNLLQNQYSHTEKIYLEKLSIITNNLNSFFSNPPYSSKMNPDSFPTHAYLKAHFLHSGVVRKENGVYRLYFEQSDKHRMKEGRDILKALAERSYGPAAHTIALSEATSRTPTSEDDLNGEMMQHYKKGMESGYQASQVKIALTYLSYLNQLISEYTPQTFNPLFGLDEKALIQNLKAGIEASNIDAIEATTLIVANIIGAMRLLHPDENLRKDPIENEQMKTNIQYAVNALLPLFPENIKAQLKKLLEDINSTTPPEPANFKASVKSINDTIQKYLTEKYPNTKTIDAILTQMDIVVPNPTVDKIVQPSQPLEATNNTPSSDRPPLEPPGEAAIPYFEGEDPTVVDRVLEDRIRQNRLKLNNNPLPIAKQLESVKENLKKQDEINLSLQSGVAPNKVHAITDVPIPKKPQNAISPLNRNEPSIAASAVSKASASSAKKPELKKEKSFTAQFLALFRSKSEKKEATAQDLKPRQKEPKGGAAPR